MGAALITKSRGFGRYLTKLVFEPRNRVPGNISTDVQHDKNDECRSTLLKSG
jgi:hypothetical protein